MSNGFYLLIVLAVAFLSIIAGFRTALTGQLASLLGFGFGAVASRVLTPEMMYSFEWVAAFTPAPDYNEFAANMICGVVIYSIVFFGFSFLSKLFKSALSVIEIGIFNRITGSFFSLIKNLLWLSIIFNILICFNSESGLLRYERANDGNLVAGVMALTPAILGCYGADDFAHFHQLKEAKSISCNFNTNNDVIIING